MTQIRRVVTGHDASGKAIVLSDGPVPTVHGNPIRPGQLSFEVWKTHASPAPIGAAEPEPTTGPRSLQPPPLGTVFRISVVPPEAEETRKLTPEQARELFRKSGAGECVGSGAAFGFGRHAAWQAAIRRARLSALRPKWPRARASAAVKTCWHGSCLKGVTRR